jgi:hypothetical protein
MKKVSRIVVIVLVAIVLGSVAFLATWDIPPPVTAVEKVIPDERFPH